VKTKNYLYDFTGQARGQEAYNLQFFLAMNLRESTVAAERTIVCAQANCPANAKGRGLEISRVLLPP
jgi:hypothetical protein